MDRGSRMKRVVQMDRVMVCGIIDQCPQLFLVVYPVEF